MSEEVAISLEGSDLKWMREAAEVMERTRNNGHRTYTVHYGIPGAELRSLYKLGLVFNDSLVLTDKGVDVANILRGHSHVPAPTVQDAT